MNTRSIAIVLASLATTLICAGARAEDETVAALKQEITALRARLEMLEDKVSSLSQPQRLQEVAVSGGERAAAMVEGAEPVAERQGIEFGGALRFNAVYRDDVDASVGKRGESGLDVFRLNVDGSIDNLLVSAEYRFYSYMSTIRHGWVGYEFEDDSQLQVGINQVPFGLLPYAAHNAWFGVPYYVGLGDDYDMGIKYQRSDGSWNSHLAFYKNEELNDATNLDRYSFDLVRDGEQQNEEINQLNGRVAYTFGRGSNCETEVGASLEAGQVYNTVTVERGDHRAYGLHLDSRCGRWNFQLQGTSYEYDVRDPVGVDSAVVRMGAFAGAYDIDSDADILVANVAYNLPSPWEAIDSVTCYNDYSRLYKSLAGATDSQVNTIGCAIGSGPIFTYVDYILARNMPYFGAGSLAGGGEDDWQSRLNINIGYYW